MNTKTMRLPPRRVPDSMPNKRKERDGYDLKQPTHPPPAPPPPPTKPPPVMQTAGHPILSNQLLAGYLAHEFITRATLFGQPWDPSRRRRIPAAEFGRGIGEKSEPITESELEPMPMEEKRRRYAEVASLLKSDGAHVPGIVNPSQLSRFLEM